MLSFDRTTAFHFVDVEHRTDFNPEELPAVKKKGRAFSGDGRCGKEGGRGVRLDGFRRNIASQKMP